MYLKIYPVKIPTVEPYVEPMPLKLTEKSKQIIAQRFLGENDVVEVVVKTKDGQTKTFVKEAK